MGAKGERKRRILSTRSARACNAGRHSAEEFGVQDDKNEQDQHDDDANHNDALLLCSGISETSQRLIQIR